MSSVEFWGFPNIVGVPIMRIIVYWVDIGAPLSMETTF